MEEEIENIEEKKKKQPFDKFKFVQRIFAIVVIIIMLFSVCGTLLFYWMNR